MTTLTIEKIAAIIHALPAKEKGSLFQVGDSATLTAVSVNMAKVGDYL